MTLTSDLDLKGESNKKVVPPNFLTIFQLMPFGASISVICLDFPDDIFAYLPASPPVSIVSDLDVDNVVTTTNFYSNV